MHKITRGDFLSLSAVLAGAASLTKLPFRGLQAQGAPATTQIRGAGVEADLIAVNARVLTMDPTPIARAEAFAVKDGRFLAIGSNADIRNLASARTRVIDAQRMTVLPGFIDAHCHPRGVSELYGVVVTALKSKAELIEALRRKAAQTPPGFWVSGELFDDTKLTDPTPLTRHDLDRVSTEHPVAVNHRRGHTSWYNSKAFELAGVTRSTPDPDDVVASVRPVRRISASESESKDPIARARHHVEHRAGRRRSAPPRPCAGTARSVVGRRFRPR